MVFTVKIEGPAGSGVKSAGRELVQLAIQSGYYAYNWQEYASLIRGGHNISWVAISSEPIGAPLSKADLTVTTDSFAAAQVMENIKIPATAKEQIVINGNDAAALGAIAGGMQFAAIYPMSPTSEILQVLAAHQEEFGYIYKQPEDEISAVTMAIGASFAGARAMVATSGGGFCLMTEGLGLAAMTETPLVIIDGMRPGPATGLPTWSEQGDLKFVLSAHQGDFPRIVLAPSDAKETFELTRQAFNLADKYQTPVIILLDKNICSSEQSFPIFDSPFEFYRGKFTTTPSGEYKRYAQADDGISVRTIPGTGNFFLANSDEHDEAGFSTEEAATRKAQMDKRMKKLETCASQELPKPQLFGPPEVDLTVVSWGSNKNSILAALKDFPNVNYLHLTWFSPFPAEAVKEQLSKSKRLLGIENNFSGQMCAVVEEKTGIEIKDKLLKYDGRPIYPEEIAEKIKLML
jgi:2-oxoglutarate ferredoxin oxidoreductase subunit alpha